MKSPASGPAISGTNSISQSCFSSRLENMSDNSKMSKDEYEGGDKENSISKTDKNSDLHSQHLRNNTHEVSLRID